MNKYRALLRLFNKWDIFLTLFNKNTIIKTLFSKHSRIIAGCFLCAGICFYLDFNLWSLIAVFLLLMMIYRLRIQEWMMRHYKKKREKLQSAAHIFSKLKKLRKENRLQSEIEETDKKIESKNQEIEELNCKVMMEAENFTIDKIKKVRKVALSHLAVTISIITLLATLLGFFGKLTLYYFTIGKFDYWGINRENISFFGNGLDGYINWGIMISILLILFPLLNKWKYKDSYKNEIVIEWKSFFLLYIPACLCIIGFIALPFVSKASYEDNRYLLVNFLLLTLIFFSLFCIELSNVKSFRDTKQEFIVFLIDVFFIAAAHCVSFKLLYGKELRWIWVFIAFCFILGLFYLVLCGAMIALYNLLKGIINIIVSNKSKLVIFSGSKRRIKINNKLFAFLTLAALLLYFSYLLSGASLKLKNEYAVVKTESLDKDKEFILLLGHNNQYYISDFETIGKESDITLRIFNGKYHIISNENIEVRKQKSYEKEKTNKSRDEYLEIQNQITEFYSYIFSMGNPKLEKIFPKLQKSTNNE